MLPPLEAEGMEAGGKEIEEANAIDPIFADFNFVWAVSPPWATQAKAAASFSLARDFDALQSEPKPE